MAMTRFATMQPRTARMALVVLLLAMLLSGWCASAGPAPKRIADSGGVSGGRKAATDRELYERTATAVAGGEGYYAAAVRINTENGYPVRPFVTVRMPTLTWLLAVIGINGARALLGCLTVLFVGIWTWRLRLQVPLPAQIAVAVAAFSSTVVAYSEQQVFIHEVWAGELIGISLALRTDRRWTVAVILGTFAMLIREIAAPYAVTMCVIAFAEGRRREAAGWAVSLAVLALALLVHRAEVLGMPVTGNVRSHGWWGLLGYSFYIRAMATNAPILAENAGLSGVLIVLSYLGWIGTKAATGGRVLAVQAVYVPVIALCARRDNWYWAELVHYVLPIGLPLAGVALWDLVKAGRFLPRWMPGRPFGRYKEGEPT